MPNVQLLLLAAGASSRMGKPKQLLNWLGQTLIRHQLKNLLSTNKLVSIVLGAYSEQLIKIIDELPVTIYTNKNWQNGMGTSIAYGVKKMMEKDSTLDGVLITLIDQPLLTSNHFKEMLNLFESRKKQIIVSLSENGWAGAPVLFDKTYFEDLTQLKGDEGAKVITGKYRDSVQFIKAGNLLIDIDTPGAYQQLLDEYISEK